MKITTPMGKEITAEQAEREERICCPCGFAVIEDEWLPEQKQCIYCWEVGSET